MRYILIAIYSFIIGFLLGWGSAICFDEMMGHKSHPDLHWLENEPSLPL